MPGRPTWPPWVLGTCPVIKDRCRRTTTSPKRYKGSCTKRFSIQQPLPLCFIYNKENRRTCWPSPFVTDHCYHVKHYMTRRPHYKENTKPMYRVVSCFIYFSCWSSRFVAGYQVLSLFTMLGSLCLACVASCAQAACVTRHIRFFILHFLTFPANCASVYEACISASILADIFRCFLRGHNNPFHNRRAISQATNNSIPRWRIRRSFRWRS